MAEKRATRKNVTIRDLAAAAEVSIGTVSRALKNQPGLSEETRAAVMRVAQQMGYDVTRLRGEKPRRILFLFNRTIATLASNPFYSVVLQGAEDACHEAQVSLSLLSIGPGDSLQTRVRRHEPDALLMAGFFDVAMLVQIAALGVPTVAVDHRVPGILCVNGDNLQGAWLATHHLIQQKRKRIAMISGPQTHHSVALRTRGYRKALFDAGRLADPDLEVGLDTHLIYEEAGRAAMKSLLALPEPPDAVFAYNDETAINAMQVCAEAGLSVPRDVAFVGYDDILASATSRPSLTTIRVDKEALGRRAATRLIAGDIEPGEELLPVELIVRESSARR